MWFEGRDRAGFGCKVGVMSGGWWARQVVMAGCGWEMSGGLSEFESRSKLVLLVVLASGMS